MDRWLWGQDVGGYFNTAVDASADLLVRERSYMDSATPAANGIAIANLVRLFLLTENLGYFQQAEQALQSFGSVMTQFSRACPSLFAALGWYQHPILVRTSAAEIATLSQQYLPTVVLALAPNLPTGVVGLVCQGLSCLDPAHSSEQLKAQIQQLPQLSP
ncbi:hypothetical protein [Neosynechococcus sphagnicola]|uniref:hypothetical protein n=1 Tax=Neosynechococcus sphagnicola TaxID=1501145 RepID=UPI000A9CDF65